MADIFISYASLDRPTARRLAEALEACGWSVWWDYRGLRGGQHFERVIEEEIAKARVVIVVWSQNSVGSDWVRAEAAQALDEKKLAPVRIDSAALPLRYRTIHTLDLSSWTGESEAEPFERLLETLSDQLGSPKTAVQPERRAEPRSQAEPTNGSAIEAAYERGDYATPLSLARPSADQGDAVAQFNLGRMYEQGRGVPQDDAEAVQWYRKAAEQGHTDAQSNLGWMYQQGRGVPQDDAEAAQWYRKAAEQGDARAQENLGEMYQYGRGVAQDNDEAARWFRKAAEQGHTDAQTNLGVMYALGHGVARDDAEAVQCFRKAAEQGEPYAQSWLGRMYEQGRGVQQDDAEAARWYRRAAAQGNIDAQASLDRLFAKGKPLRSLLSRLFG